MSDFEQNSAAASASREASYRIGAVARLTGIPPNTLRVWERRYRIVEPRRTAKGGRLYGADDIARLALVKVLVDHGDAISAVANLSIEALEARLSQRNQVAAETTSQATPRAVCIVGPALSVQVRLAHTPPDDITVVGVYESLRDYQTAVPFCQLLIVEVPALDPPQLEALAQIFEAGRAESMLVVYAFANQATLEAARERSFALARAPLRPAELWQLSRVVRRPDGSQTAKTTPAPSEPLPARRFSDAQLARFAAVSVRIACECPHHLADMIRTLVAFEDYSLRCENRNAADAELHRYLHASTARARAILEQALAQVAKAEAIDF